MKRDTVIGRKFHCVYFSVGVAVKVVKRNKCLLYSNAKHVTFVLVPLPTCPKLPPTV
jgi:hypothetical protein